MIRRLFYITFIFFALRGSGVLSQEIAPSQGWSPAPQYITPVITPVVTPAPVVPTYLFRPRVIYQPYQYQGSILWDRGYGKPVRNILFGRYRRLDLYRPIGAAQ